MVTQKSSSLLREVLLKNTLSSSSNRFGRVDNQLIPNGPHSPSDIVAPERDFLLKNARDRLVEQFTALTETSHARETRATDAGQRGNRSNHIHKKSPSDVLDSMQRFGCKTLRSDLAIKLAAIVGAHQTKGTSRASIKDVFPFPTKQHKSRVTEVDHSEVIDFPKFQVHSQKKQDTVLPIQKMEEVLFSSEIEQQGIADIETQTERMKRRKGGSTYSGEKHKRIRLNGQEACQLKDHESAEKEVAIVDKLHGQMLSYSDKEVSNSPDSGGVLLGTSNEKITPSDSLTKGCAYLEVSHNLQNLSEFEKETTSNGQGQSDNARGDERAMHLMTTTNNTPSSTKQGEGPLPQRSGRSPIIKNLWEIIESTEIFQLMPQEPHFRPFEHENELWREGHAIGNMLSFANLVDRLRDANIDDPRTIFENMLKALSEFEKLGFSVLPLQTRVRDLLALKDNYSQLHDNLKPLESGLIAGMSKLHARDASIGELEKELQTATMEKVNIVCNLAEKQRTLDGISERIQNVKCVFDRIIASPSTSIQHE